MEKFKGKNIEFQKAKILSRGILGYNEPVGACGAVWLAHRPFKPAVAGSNPAGPAKSHDMMGIIWQKRKDLT